MISQSYVKNKMSRFMDGSLCIIFTGSFIKGLEGFKAQFRGATAAVQMGV